MKKASARSSHTACFELPQGLYGRQEELNQISNAYETVLEGRFCAMFVHGYAGTGKTALIYEAVRSLNLKDGHFIVGKSDLLQQNIPYASFSIALGSLVRQLLTESQEELDRWKKRILRALGRNGAVVAEIIPELKWVIGEQPAVDDLPPKEAQNRFLRVFVDLIRTLSCKGQPLVLFLDDLQWADPASLLLLQHLIRNEDLPYLFFIGALRDGEAKENQTLWQMLLASEQYRQSEQHLFLTSLSEWQVAEFIADALDENPETMVPMATVLHSKSCGNPFFLRQFLLLLYDEGHLSFNSQKNQWLWDQDIIQRLEPGEDVLCLLVERLQKLPVETLEDLKVASCVGSRFDLETLERVCGNTSTEIADHMVLAVREGLVLETSSRGDSPTYKFLHDRVHQAVYSLIPEGNKKEMHLRIGRLLLHYACETEAEERILPIMDHFNRSLELLDDPDERSEVARYNLMAGRKARNFAAYASALEYFMAGMSLLPLSAWEDAYELSYALHVELAQTEYLSANVSAAEMLFDAVIEHARTESERAEINSLKVLLYAGMGKYSEAVHTGLHALGELGVELPIPPRLRHVWGQIFLFCVRKLLWRRDEETSAERVATPVQARASELLVRLACIVSIYEPRAYLHTILKTSNYVTHYGNADMAAIGYLGYGIVAGNVFGEYAEGHRLARVGLRLAERSEKSYSKCYVNFGMGSIISHWTRPASQSITYLQKAIDSGLDSGDLLLTGYANRFVLETAYLCGQSLDGLAEQLEQATIFAGKTGQQYLALNSALYRHITGFLREGTGDGFRYVAEGFEEDEFVAVLRKDHASQAAYHILRMQMQYLSGNYEAALRETEFIESRKEAIAGFLIVAEYNFYQSLTLAALCDGLPRIQQTRAVRTLRRNRGVLGKWAKDCPENFAHKYLLVAAEEARLANKGESAINLYERAIEDAHLNGFAQDEALAGELAARFHLGQNRKIVARAYFEEACAGYDRWGARAKARALRELYALEFGEMKQKREFFPEAEAQKEPTSAMESTEATPSAEFGTLRKAIRSISAQADQDNMLSEYLYLAMESSGADRGILMLEKDGNLWIEAEGTANGEMATGKPVPAEKKDGFSKALVRYAFRTQETTVWKDGERGGAFFADPYLAKTQVKSVACVPVLLRGIVAGVLYLENETHADAFDCERLQLPRLLSEQLIAVKKLLAYLEEQPNEMQAGRLAESLTGREKDALRLIAAGLSNREIAETLGLTANTVKGYIKSLYGKLGASRRVQIVARSKALGLLKTE